MGFFADVVRGSSGGEVGPYGGSPLTPSTGMSGSPYVTPQYVGDTKPWEPFRYTPMINTTNMAVGNAINDMGLGVGTTPYLTSPYAGRLMDTGRSLSRMAGRGGARTPYQGLYETGIGQENLMNMLSPYLSQAGLSQRDAEQKDIGQLITAYGLSGQAYGQQRSLDAAYREMKVQQRRAKADTLSSIPVVGGLLKGIFS